MAGLDIHIFWDLGDLPLLNATTSSPISKNDVSKIVGPAPPLPAVK